MFPLAACRPKSPPVVSLVAPSTPTNLAAVGGTDSVALSWDAMAGAASYDVEISSDGGSTYGSPNNVGTNAYTDSTANAHFLATTGLVFYKVRAVNAAGNSSFASAVSASPFKFYDTFTGTDAVSLASHQLNIGPTGYTLSASAAWQLFSNQAVLSSGGASDAALIDVGANDCSVTLTLTSAPTGTGYAGIAIRYQDTSNYYAFIVNHGDSHWYLKQNIAGSSNNVEAVAGGPVQNGDVLKITTSGNNITAFVNGVQVYQYTSATQFHSVNTFGLFQGAHDTSALFDNLKITVP